MHSASPRAITWLLLVQLFLLHANKCDYLYKSNMVSFNKLLYKPSFMYVSIFSFKYSTMVSSSCTVSNCFISNCLCLTGPYDWSYIDVCFDDFLRCITPPFLFIITSLHCRIMYFKILIITMQLHIFQNFIYIFEKFEDHS